MAGYAVVEVLQNFTLEGIATYNARKVELGEKGWPDRTIPADRLTVPAEQAEVMARGGVWRNMKYDAGLVTILERLTDAEYEQRRSGQDVASHGGDCECAYHRKTRVSVDPKALSSRDIKAMAEIVARAQQPS